MSENRNTIRMRLKPHEHQLVMESRNKETRNVLVIGDLHAPFIKGQCNDGESYLEHCLEMYEKYNCNQVIQIGDCIDSALKDFYLTRRVEVLVVDLDIYQHPRWVLRSEFHDMVRFNGMKNDKAAREVWDGIA